jgi:hypothetical protein
MGIFWNSPDFYSDEVEASDGKNHSNEISIVPIKQKKLINHLNKTCMSKIIKQIFSVENMSD